MKKSYIAPQTEAINVNASGILMASPGGFKNPNVVWGTGGYDGPGN